ncbi:MAG: LysR family transcriptional regulator [Flavobacteriales bacterium]|nr:LysR family transcriptional regulator [Flavobacteriales bacterium]
MELELENDPRFRNFDWEKAKNFYYVAKLGSFVNAGRFLNLSQSSLSRQIIYLEQHLGCPLFSRHSGGVKLTRKGKELFSIVEATYIGFKGFTRNTHANTVDGKKRKIRIATTHAITSYILDSLIFEYNKMNPHLIFELISADHLIDIVMNDVDIAIRPYDPDTRNVQEECLFTLEKKLFASTEYLEKYGEPQTVEDLKNHYIIAPAHPEEYPYSELTWILKLGMPPGSQHIPVFTSNSLECLVKAAREGMGIIGGYEKMEIIKNSHLKNVLPEVKEKKTEIYFIYPNYFKKDIEIINLKEYLQKHIV